VTTHRKRKEKEGGERKRTSTDQRGEWIPKKGHFFGWRKSLPGKGEKGGKTNR